MSEQRLRFLIDMNQKLEELLATNPGDPVDWPDAAKLRLHALWLDKYDLDREVYDRTQVQADLRRMANYIEELDKLMLTPQDLMVLRDSANALSDIDDDLAMELHTVGDKIADLLKLMVDTP